MASNEVSNAEGFTIGMLGLISSGHDMNKAFYSEDPEENTPLMMASRVDDIVVVEALLEAGVEVDKVDKSGTAALTMASACGHADVVKVLLAKGADVNKADEDGDTALILASGNGHAAIVYALLAAGADPNAKNNDGNTAKDLAYEAVWYAEDEECDYAVVAIGDCSSRILFLFSMGLSVFTASAVLEPSLVVLLS